ncbi:MAG: metallophosphoesterase [Nanoarchaeota archaeon]|nr:metallophosphoesterase [Nanoarchaeota archaeon]
MGKGFLLDKEMLDLFSSLTPIGIEKVVNVISSLGINERVITKSIFLKHFERFRDIISIDSEGTNIDVDDFFKGTGYLKEKSDESDSISKEVESLGAKVKLISAPAFTQKKIEVKDFVKHFRSRYEKIRAMLEEKNFENLSSLGKIGDNRGNYTVIVSVMGKRVTKNKNLFIEVEDMTGTSIVLINQNKKDVFSKGREILLDDVLAFSVSGTKDMLFANDLFYPEASLAEKRYGKTDEYIAFISDIHVGSNQFLEKNLLKFVKWLNGGEGDARQRELALKVRYLFMTGDNVDGVSVYPGQDKALEIKDMKGQYEKLVEIIKLIRTDVKIIMCPGQHDAVWVGEPQPIIGDYWAPGLYKMKNLTLVPNPAVVEINSGFKVLMYHGASMHAIIEWIEDIRLNHGHDNPTRVTREMLKRRHLAPMHGLCDYIPCEDDPMVIDIIPDIVITGDQHRSEISMYNNILMISSSCFQSKTPFEEKVGNNPDPCKVPLFNLKTREIKMLDFSDGVEDSLEIDNTFIELEDEIEIESENEQ